MVIILMAIGGYFVIAYWCLLMVIILVAIGDYYINGY
jgi:hypothetical protein